MLANSFCVKSGFGVLARISTVVFVSAALSGCYVGRVYELKEQFCEFDSNFSYSMGDRPGLSFGQPVLLDSDVRKVVGYQPTEVLAEEDGFVHRYRVEKVTLDGSPGESYTFELGYQLVDGKALLHSVELPPEFSLIEDYAMFHNPRAVPEAAAEICNSELQFSLRAMEEDIDPRHLENLPSQAQLVAMLGAPSWYSEEEMAMIYEYQVVGEQGANQAVRMLVWFDADGTKPIKVETRYRNMRSLADLERGKVRFSYKFWSV